MSRTTLISAIDPKPLAMREHESILPVALDWRWPARLHSRVLALLKRWLRNQQQRSALRRLDDDQLRDVGISRDQAEHEAAKYFWQ